MYVITFPIYGYMILNNFNSEIKELKTHMPSW
jgi:hypothetical protein